MAFQFPPSKRKIASSNPPSFFFSLTNNGGSQPLLQLSSCHFSPSLQGAWVSIHARSKDNLVKAKKAIDEAGDVVAYAADVRDFEYVKKATDEAGDIDVLVVVNQGVFVPEDLTKRSMEEKLRSGLIH